MYEFRHAHKILVRKPEVNNARRWVNKLFLDNLVWGCGLDPSGPIGLSIGM